jgi:hypothetical protein
MAYPTNTAAVGGLIMATDFSSLFDALEQIRVRHYSGAGQSSDGRTALLAAVPTGAPVPQDSITPDIVSSLKTQLERFNSSVYGSGAHGAGIIAPSVGDLITKVAYDVDYNEVSTLDARSTADGSYNATCVSGYNASNYSAYNSGNYSSYNGGYGTGDYSYGTGNSYDYSGYYSNSSNYSGYSANSSNYSGYSSNTGQLSPHTNYNVSNYSSGNGSSYNCPSHVCTPNY